LIVGFATFTLAGIRRPWTNAAYWTTIATAALVGLVVALPVLVPYVQLQQSTGFGRTLADASRYSADWRAYLASSAVAHRWMLTAIGHWNEVLFPGFVATIAGLAGLAIGVRKPDLIRSGPLSPDVRSGADRPVQSGADRSIQSGADRPVQNGTDRPVQNGTDRPVQSGADLIRSANANAREISILYGSLGALALWASFGPRAGLYTFLYRVLPPFSLMRAPARFGIIVTLALTVLAGIAVRVVLERSARPGLLGVLLALATAAELAFPLHFRQVPALAPAYRMLATLPRGPVLELPFWSTNRDRFGHALYMMNSTAHWMPLINGYSDYIPPDALEAAPVLSLFPSRDSFSRLASQRPRYAVFHMNLFGVEDRAAAAARIREFAPYLRPLYTDAETQLYEIVGFPP
jgi:hypothetical protein